MKYLVTGCAGFIGFSLSRKLLENGSKVIGVDNFNKYYSPVLKKDRLDILRKNKNFQFYKTDISNLMAMDKIFLKNKPFTIAHLAAQAGVRYSLTHPFIYEKVNILGFLNILELAKKYKIKNIVYASSSSVYGGIKKIPFREDMVINQPVSLYGATKASNELFAYTYHHLYEINTIGLRFFTCFDGNTEVLTLNGIKNIKDILIGEKIYTLNPDTKNMEISNVVATQKLKAP